VSNGKSINCVIASDNSVSDVWNKLLSPDPFPGNLFIEDGATYVCNPLGTGRIGGYRFELDNGKWLILRPFEIEKDSLVISYELVDIKGGPVKDMKIFIKIEEDNRRTQIVINLIPEYSTLIPFRGFIAAHKLRKRLSKLTF
jgi:hypothetical protein